MDNEKITNTTDTYMIPYVVFESAEAKNERIIKRLIIALVITIILMFATNIIWVIEFCSFEYTTEETTYDLDAGSGTANFIGENGDITYGKD